MNLQSLRTFQIAAEAESLTVAANKLLYAQSTVTTQIKQLEAEWGVQLFRKEGRGVRLTPEGRALLAKVSGVIQQLEALDLAVDGIAAGGAGHLRIGAMEPAASWKVAPVLAKFTENRPLLQINFETGSSYGLSDRVIQQELEIAISNKQHWTTHLCFEPWFVEQNGVLLREDHPLARKDTLCIDDLRDVRLVFQDTLSAYRGVMENDLAYWGRAYPFANLELNSVGAMVAYVRQGIGSAVLPAYCLDPIPTGCVLRFIEGHTFEREIGLIYSHKARLPLVVEEVIDVLRTALKEA